MAESFKFNFRYIYDVLSLRNVWFCILNERDIMDTILKSSSYLDLYLGSGNWQSGPMNIDFLFLL